MANSILVKAEKLFRSKIGYREGPKNNETMFGKWFGMDFVAWCAIFLSWGSANSGLTYLGKPWRFASTVAAKNHAQKNKRWTTVPTVGTIAMMQNSSTTGHVGYVIALLRRNGVLIVVTIEGNTNDQGAREGNGVWLRERVASSWDGYIVLDQTYLNDETLPPEEDDMRNFPLVYRVVGDETGDAKNLEGAIFISGDYVTTHALSYAMFVHHANLKLIATGTEDPGWIVAERWSPSAETKPIAIAHVPLADHDGMAANTPKYQLPSVPDDFALKVAEGVAAHLTFTTK